MCSHWEERRLDGGEEGEVEEEEVVSWVVAIVCWEVV